MDRGRPVAHPDFRDIPLQRYWSLNGKYLTEECYLNRLSGYEYVQSYQCDTVLKCFAIEPNTYGMFSYSPDGYLYYSDRRESLPTNLSRTAIYQEPLYNLIVNYDAADNPFGIACF
jgi:hypothetical protein